MVTSLTNEFHSFTRLPVRVVKLFDRPSVEIMVTTPHKGDVVINLKTTHHPLFGSVTETDRSISEIACELQSLEQEVKEYLLDKWIKGLK